MTKVDPFTARAATCTTDAERWAVIRDAWDLYCEAGAGAFDWDYDSRYLMDDLLRPDSGSGVSTEEHP